jgi:hypothetical protein
MTLSLDNLNALDFGRKFKDMLALRLDEAIQNSPLLEYEGRQALELDDNDMTNPEEMKVVADLNALSKVSGGDNGTYENGCLNVTFTNKLAVINFCDQLEANDNVLTYDIEAYSEHRPEGYVDDTTIDLDKIEFDYDFVYDVFIYLQPYLVTYDSPEVEVDEDFEAPLNEEDSVEDATMLEVTRKVKVNFRGKKRIKMQCAPGYKWYPEGKVCQKITGAEVATMRKALRQAVRTRRAKGQSFKVRIARKSKKAMRYRKGLGL